MKWAGFEEKLISSKCHGGFRAEAFAVGAKCDTLYINEICILISQQVNGLADVSFWTLLSLSGGERCKDMLIEIASADKPTSYNHCALREGEIFNSERINCFQPIVGRYVKLSFTANVNQELNEIEIIGH